MKDYSKITIKNFWREAKKYKFAFWTTVLSTSLASLGSIIPPLFYRDFFNILSEPGVIGSRPQLLAAILVKVLIIHLIGWLFWRVATYTASAFQARVMSNLYNLCFAYLHKHSVSFFNNTFIGSLVKKVNRYTRAFLGITDAFFFDFLQIALNLIIIFIILRIDLYLYFIIFNHK